MSRPQMAGVLGILTRGFVTVFAPSIFAPMILASRTRTNSGWLVPCTWAMETAKYLTFAIGVLCGNQADEFDDEQNHCNKQWKRQDEWCHPDRHAHASTGRTPTGHAASGLPHRLSPVAALACSRHESSHAPIQKPWDQQCNRPGQTSSGEHTKIAAAVLLISCIMNPCMTGHHCATRYGRNRARVLAPMPGTSRSWSTEV